jgi:hypothetical protein
MQGAAFALVLLGSSCAGWTASPYPEAQYDCEESDCTHCVPIEGAPHPKGHLCSSTGDQPPPPAVPDP